MDGWMDARMDVMDGCMDGFDGWMDAWMDLMDGWMDGWLGE
jgi:hypothetical protein